MIVCDSSIIYKMIKSEKINHLSGQSTSSIAVYELGNILWKSSVLTNVYSQKEASELLDLCEFVLEDMRVVHSDLNDIYKAAFKYKTSFYDAAYLCLALDMNVPLATLDRKLVQKASSMVKVLTFDQWMASMPK